MIAQHAPSQTSHFSGLARTLALGLALLSVMALLVTSTVQILVNVSAQQALVAAQQQIAADQMTDQVAALIQQTVNILEAAAVIGRPFEGSRLARALFLQSMLALHPPAQTVAVLDSEGQELQTLARRTPAAPDALANHAGSDLLRQISQRQSYIGGFEIDAETGDPTLIIAVPVIDIFGTLEGALAATVNLRPIWELVAALSGEQTGQLYVVDRAGRMLASHDLARVLAGETVAHLAHIADFIAQPAADAAVRTRQSRGIDGQPIVATTVPMIRPDWAVIVEQSVEQAYQPVFWSLMFSAGWVLIVAVAASGIGVVLARRLTRPLRYLTDTAGRIAAGELALDIDTRGGGEIGLLARSFAAMRDALLARMRELRAEITERQHMEDILRENEAFLQNVVENIPDMIFVKDADTLRFVRLNKAGEQLLGYTREELLGKTDHDFFPAHEADFFVENDRAVLTRNTLLDTPEESIHTQHLGERILHTKKIPLCDPEGRPRYLLGISADITDQKRAEDAIRRLNAELEQRIRDRTADLEMVNHELKSFAYVVSHDLKAPLRAIARLAQWLVADYAPAFDASGQEMVDLLVGRVKRMDALIDGILEYSRIGRVMGPFELIDLNQLLPEVIDLLAPPATAAITLPPTLPTVVGDRTRLAQIFQNLIGNAVKFAADAPVTVTIGWADDGACWQFSVTDTGPGIDPKYHDRIFQIFQTLHARDQFESTGIGLALVKKIVEFCGGQVGVESAVGQGCTFWFTLPKAAAAPGASEIVSSA
jgi:PAS domain S-box-containing protein